MKRKKNREREKKWERKREKIKSRRKKQVIQNNVYLIRLSYLWIYIWANLQNIFFILCSFFFLLFFFLLSEIFFIVCFMRQIRNFHVIGNHFPSAAMRVFPYAHESQWAAFYECGFLGSCLKGHTKMTALTLKSFCYLLYFILFNFSFFLIFSFSFE